MNLLLDTLPMLGNVLLLCFFVFFIFGIVGVQLWSGLLRQRCRIELDLDMDATAYDLSKLDMPFSTSYYMPEDTSLDYICSTNEANGIHKCHDLPVFMVNGSR